MLRPREIGPEAMGEIVTALQEAFYLRGENGKAVWDPDSAVSGGDLVDVMGELLRTHGLCPETVLPAGDDIDLDRLLEVWETGNRRIVVILLSERPRSETAAFSNRLTLAGHDVDTLIALMRDREALPVKERWK